MVALPNGRYNIVSLQTLVALKRAGYAVWQLECRASNVTANVRSDHYLQILLLQFFLHFFSFFPHFKLIHKLIHGCIINYNLSNCAIEVLHNQWLHGSMAGVLCSNSWGSCYYSYAKTAQHSYWFVDIITLTVNYALIVVLTVDVTHKQYLQLIESETSFTSHGLTDIIRCIIRCRRQKWWSRASEVAWTLSPFYCWFLLSLTPCRSYGQECKLTLGAAVFYNINMQTDFHLMQRGLNWSVEDDK